jgi:hypothetical protein
MACQVYADIGLYRRFYDCGIHMLTSEIARDRTDTASTIHYVTVDGLNRLYWRRNRS